MQTRERVWEDLKVYVKTLFISGYAIRVQMKQTNS